MHGTPPAEVVIDTDLVRALLHSQRPDLADLPVTIVDAGWDNALVRIGANLAARLPRRSASAALIENEQRWLPRIAPHLSLPVPAPIYVGLPDCGYPWRWSIVPWLQGEAADLFPPAVDQASALAEFFATLHVTAPPDAPLNPYRGVPLRVRADAVEARMHRLRDRTNLFDERLRKRWRIALDAPVDADPTWIHGDLHPRNILVESGCISGVIDWGDIARGDPATDLAAIWLLFADHSARAVIREHLRLTDPTWDRARGWAIFFGVTLLDTGLVNDPRNARLGESILRNLSSDLDTAEK